MNENDRIRDWLEGQVAKRGRGAKAALAAHLGVRPDAITRMLNLGGKETRLIKAHELSRIAEFFGTPFPEQSQRSLASNATLPPSYRPFPDRALPVFGQAEGGIDGRFVLNGQRVASVFCPPVLADVEGAYAVYVHGDSMAPKFEAGETVWLHPYVPVKKGDYVVVQLTIGGDEMLHGYVKQFISRNSKHLVLRQLNPPEGEEEIFQLPTSQVFSIHKIVFSQLL
ncbi:phage repressor protein C with HTH and peptisase S24 domain [Rhodoligotrophos appendicifer]|uniref:S24 family peptidase n=1 Tax=Rhodoligotrophos appendicifer TaxID=987056 RepID=UPI0011860F2D|nr:helix-turn-helix transcriptional regulator [Rhodoligotrophos appendicifer]